MSGHQNNLDPSLSHAPIGNGAYPGRDLPPDGVRPTSWKWWRYHDLSDKEILDHLVHGQRYDKRELPPSVGTSCSTSLFPPHFPRGNLLMLTLFSRAFTNQYQFDGDFVGFAAQFRSPSQGKKTNNAFGGAFSPIPLLTWSRYNFEVDKRWVFLLLIISMPPHYERMNEQGVANGDGRALQCV